MPLFHGRTVHWGLLLCLIKLDLSTQEAKTSVTCSGTEFSVDCGTHNVILIKKATYASQVWCSSKTPKCSYNATGDLHRFCSGRQYCSLTVTDGTFSHSKCTSGGLHVTYVCIGVVSPSPGSCPLRTVEAEGYIAAWQALHWKYGSRECPWRIEGRPGQHISVSMYDFGLYNQKEISQEDKNVKKGYLEMQDIYVDRKTEPMQVLPNKNGLEDGMKHVWLSKTHRIELIVLFDAQSAKPYGNFLLRYKVQGCKTPPIPSGARVLKSTLRTLEVKCDYTESVWVLTCDGVKWDSNLGKCGNGSSLTQKGESQEKSPWRLLIIIGSSTLALIIALVTCGLLTLCCWRRRRRQKLQSTYNVRKNNAVASDREHDPGADTKPHIDIQFVGIIPQLTTRKRSSKDMTLPRHTEEGKDSSSREKAKNPDYVDMACMHVQAMGFLKKSAASSNAPKEACSKEKPVQESHAEEETSKASDIVDSLKTSDIHTATPKKRNIPPPTPVSVEETEVKSTYDPGVSAKCLDSESKPNSTKHIDSTPFEGSRYSGVDATSSLSDSVRSSSMNANSEAYSEISDSDLNDDLAVYSVASDTSFPRLLKCSNKDNRNTVQVQSQYAETSDSVLQEGDYALTYEEEKAKTNSGDGGKVSDERIQVADNLYSEAVPVHKPVPVLRAIPRPKKYEHSRSGPEEMTITNNAVYV